ncbi:probable E3 ubiquitin-protein ligase makorin-1 isoform X2 [Myxocyprinus asiaticus]|uniref:probable E3 ubiquitin-protein ligase makorin-1 isoform X2 n=1 Tax=Myxocyprinus asiaticus TaxID=70543 RepID=UPI002221EFAD|nr:probable E3 ubiquitin-protein ligase makorin-1 isoform X2 [Myxocyprinus asiaticus]
MDRYSRPYRRSSKGNLNVERKICWQFINGCCRYGQSCYYLHEFPAVPPFQVQCRYFQKGGCWFGDRCRYLHISQGAEGPSGNSRRGSAPAVYHPPLASHAFADRRGSEPSLPAQGACSLNRRGSESLVTSISVLQQNFECLNTGIAEEEEFGVEDVPSQHGALRHMQQNNPTYSNPLHNGSSVSSLPGAAPAKVLKVTMPEDETQVTSLTKRPDQGGAAVSTTQQNLGTFDQSKDVACGICMDKISEKFTAQEQRYGILPNCNHAFCISCIVTWRKTKDFQEDVIKGCPQCRVKSSFYIPSKHWVCDGEEKASLIASFKEKSSKLKCTFFMRHGCCPFKSECIYSHDGLPFTHCRRRCVPRNATEVLEDLDFDGIQLWSYIFALTLLDDDDDLLDFLD